MGAGGIAKVGAELIESGLKKAGSEEGASLWRNTARSMSRTFEETELSRFTGKVITDYRQSTKANVSQMAKLPAYKGVNSGKLEYDAKVAARKQTFGSNDKVLTSVMKMSHLKYGPAYTQKLMDHVAMVLHEDEIIEHEKHQSRFKIAAKEDIGTLPEFQKKPPPGAQGPAKQFAKKVPYSVGSDYRAPTNFERNVTNFVYSRFSPLIAIPHIGTAFNVVLATQNKAWGHAMADMMSRQTSVQLAQTLEASGVLGEGVLRTLRDQEKIKAGLITRHLPGGVQDVLGKVTSTPGFGYLRDMQVKFSGTASYYDAIDYADQYARDPSDKLVSHRLEQYGMHPADLYNIRQSGKLTQDQLERAVYHGVNRQIFLDTTFARSYNAQKNGMNRAFSMYHGYISMQAKFIGEELATAMRGDTKSVAGAAKFLTMLGAVFPVAGEALKVAEMAGRGQWSQIGSELNDDYEGITLQKGDTEKEKLAHFIGTYAEAQAALGSFGIAWGLIMGAHRGSLAMQMEGPIFGNAIKYFGDAPGFAEGVTTGFEGDAWKPGARDALELMIPLGIGRYLKHEALPTKREQKAARGDTSLRLKGFKNISGLSKLQ